MRSRHKIDNKKGYIHMEMKLIRTTVQRLALILPQDLDDEWEAQTGPQDENNKNLQTLAEENADQDLIQVEHHSYLEAKLSSLTSLQAEAREKPRLAREHKKTDNLDLAANAAG